VGYIQRNLSLLLCGAINDTHTSYKLMASIVKKSSVASKQSLSDGKDKDYIVDDDDANNSEPISSNRKKIKLSNHGDGIEKNYNDEISVKNSCKKKNGNNSHQRHDKEKHKTKSHKNESDDSDDVSEGDTSNNLNSEDDVSVKVEDDDEEASSQEVDVDSDESNDSEHTDEEDFGVDSNNDNGVDESMIRLLRRAAAAQGIPFEYLIQQAMMSGADGQDDDEPIEYPFGTLPKSLDDIAKFILSDKCQNILVLAGAGMSVSAGMYSACFFLFG
jgi:hypothetical protein